jgi:hypothetical protein
VKWALELEPFTKSEDFEKNPNVSRGPFVEGRWAGEFRRA